MASAARAASRSLPRQTTRFAENATTSTSRWQRPPLAQSGASSRTDQTPSEDRPLAPHLNNNRARQMRPTPTAPRPLNTARKPSGSTMPDWLNPNAKPIQFGGAENRGRRDDRQLGGRAQTRIRDDSVRPTLSRSSAAVTAAASKWAQPSTSSPIPQQTSWTNEKTGVVTPSRAAGIDSQVVSVDPEDVRWVDNASVLESEHSRHGKRGKKAGRETGNFLEQEENDAHSKASKSTVHMQRRPAHSKFKPKLVEKVSSDVYIPRNVTVANLSRLLRIPHKVLQRKMRAIGMENTDSNYMLSSDDAYVLALEFDRNPIVDDVAAFDLYPEPLPTDQSSLPLKPPVITIMGHVDHGKTTLLDTLRSASVASGEAGGITQHIGAFSVPVPSLSTPASSHSSSEFTPRTITFLDTPGHAAFSAMRARGASATDIIVLVVAADDGVMPQTKEVIELAKKDMMEDGSGVGLVVALNKIDKPGADVTAIKQALLAEGVQLEDYGGEVPCVEVSGLTGLGLDKLVETLSTLAEIKELRARGTGKAEGRVLESRVDKGRGSVATVLVTQGELTAGAHIIAGTTWARVRQMTDSTGKPVRSVTAGMPVTVSGWKELPSAGDEVLQGTEDEVKSAVTNRKRNIEQLALQADVDSINEKRLEAKAKEAAEAAQEAAGIVAVKDWTPDPSSLVKELRLIIKADVSGSAEAVAGAVQDIGNDIAKVKIIQSSVGEPTEADVDMAKAVGATLIGFSVKASNKILNYAATAGVPVITNTVIYRLMEEVRNRVQALLPPVVEQRVLGEATVQQIFEIKGKAKNVTKIAGCRVTNGVIDRSRKIRVLRNGEEVYTGSLDTLRHIKKDITEARKGSECGMALDKFPDIREGDKIQAFEETTKAGQL